MSGELDRGDWYRLAYYDGSGLIGVTYVEGFGPAHAISRARDLGCNSDGVPTPERIDKVLADDISARNKNRFIARAGLDAVFDDAA